MEKEKSCCFTGHRPGKLKMTEERLAKRLEEEIDLAIADGYTTFISGMAPGTDIVAAEIVLKKKEAFPELRLIAAVPFPGMDKKWPEEWRKRYAQVLAAADEIKEIYHRQTRWVFFARNEFMVDHAKRVIAVTNGAAGGTQKTIDYAVKNEREIRIIQDSEQV